MSKISATGLPRASRPKDMNCSSHARPKPEPASSASASPESTPPKSSAASSRRNIVTAAARRMGPHLAPLLHQSRGHRPPDRRPPVTDWLRRHPLAAFLPLQMLIYCWNLGLLSPWGDEAGTLLAMRGSLTGLIQFAANDVHPPLYYLLLYSWLKIPLGLDWAVQARLLSVAFALLGTVALDRLWAVRFEEPHAADAACAVDALAVSAALRAHVPLVFAAGTVRHRGYGSGVACDWEAGTPQCGAAGAHAARLPVYTLCRRNRADCHSQHGAGLSPQVAYGARHRLCRVRGVPAVDLALWPHP